MSSIQLADLRQITEVFDPEKVGGYRKGKFVVYHGLLYRFTADHTGAWNASHVTQCDIGEELEGLNAKKLVFSDPNNDGHIVISYET